MNMKLFFIGFVFFWSLISCADKVLESPTLPAEQTKTPSLKSAYLNYYVATTGNDANAGTLAAPFKTIQKAAEVMQPGDACLVREGVYRETVHPVRIGISEKPVCFEAYKNEKVVLDGTEKINGEWKIWKENIYHTKVPV